MAYLDETGLARFWYDLKQWIASALSNLVHRTGHESIAGRKMFVSHQTYDQQDGWNLASRVIVKTEDITRGVTPAESKYISFDYEDSTYDVANDQGSDNPRLATVEYAQYSNSGYVMKLVAVNHSNLDDFSQLRVGFDRNGIKFADAPSTSSQRNSGNDIVTRDWIPNDNRIVHTTGNETIGDTKTFTSAIHVDSAGSAFISTNPNFVMGQNPSANIANAIWLADANGVGYSVLEGLVRTNGETLLRLFVRENKASDYDSAILEVNYPASGAPYAWCPSTPDPTSANLDGRTYNKSGNADILTRDWIPRDVRIVHSTGNETVAGTKTFSSSPVVPTASYTDNSTNAANTAWAFPRYAHYYTSAAASSLDLNSFTTPGQYFFQGDGGAGTGASNLPDGVNGTLLVFTTDSPYTTVQMFFRSGTKDVTDHRVFFRQQHDVRLDTPSWSQWYRLFTDKDTIPVANGGTGQTSVANIQAGKDGNGNTISSTYLPLSGGTMTGSITRNGNLAQSGSASGAISIYNGTGASNGGGIWLYGKDHSNQGMVRVQAYNSTYRQLDCQSNGTLKWNGQTVQTSSDERLKTPMSDVPDEVLDAWGGVRWGQFQFLDAVEEKGSSARLHVGLIAQAVDRTFASENLDVCRYGILCHEVRDAEGEVPAIEQWMARYTEALCMEAAYQRRENARLKKRVADLEERLAALELKIS